MTNTYRTTFYIGLTTILDKRITEHANGIGSKFTEKYNLRDLIYFEKFTDVNQTIDRENQLKN
jgi:putative endonuclease